MPKGKKEKTMRKQLLKGFTILTGIMAFAMVAAVASANGQTTRSSVPFDFIVADKALPAGDYTVGSISSGSDALVIRGTDGNGALRLTMQAEGSSDHAKLVFHRYGQRYFLAEVWNGEGRTGRKLAPCRQERAIQKELSSIASMSNKPAQRAYETVEVVATVQ